MKNNKEVKNAFRNERKETERPAKEGSKLRCDLPLFSVPRSTKEKEDKLSFNAFENKTFHIVVKCVGIS